MHPPQPRRAARLRSTALAVLLLLAALLFAACGSEDEQQSAAGPATVVPPSAALYGEALVRPGGDVGEGVRTAIRRVARIDDPGAELVRSLDEEFAEGAGSYSYASDIEPWLGDTIGGFLLAGSGADLEHPDGAFVVAVRDRDAAEKLLDRTRADGDSRRGGTIDGVSYDVDEQEELAIALVGDFMVVGTLPGLRAAVAASRGESLADSARFTDAVDALDPDRLAWAWIDPRPLLPLVLAEQDEVDPELTRLLDSDAARNAEPATVSLTARADEIVLDVAGDADVLPQQEGEGAVSIRDLPGDAWLALATPPLGALISRSIRQSGQYDTAARAIREVAGLDLDRDLLGWLGGVAAFVRGTSPLDLGGGLVLGSSDAAASQRLVSRLERIVGNMGLPTAPTTGAGDGFQVRIPQLPQPIVVLAEGDRVAIALGLASARDALDPSESFADGEPGKSAIASLGDGFEPSLVLVFDPLLNLLGSLGLDSDPDFRSALPYLGAYRSLAAGTKYEDDRVELRIVAALQDSTTP
ncbi:DUF3352 domain-containing protein [Conexibacter woesei]|uniref:DUF3352 domain-containing protein n=1 Tax=Conexibacter woesei (strain DSM 14684 / CCUG 47730 / CIP 108061 / JCM 11494 / NBRC 100937 / ID131577) TaxID=469383 RepID=D3F231_CONWI|nr:DUF3352 domain-containing protein [Conexibacter woesei]ADB50206.1 hypothetical protein Cwoe_1780 [Conexibacter woesei DSM 14684]